MPDLAPRVAHKKTSFVAATTQSDRCRGLLTGRLLGALGYVVASGAGMRETCAAGPVISVGCAVETACGRGVRPGWRGGAALACTGTDNRCRRAEFDYRRRPELGAGPAMGA